jgi:hypothetical protein
MTPMVPSRTAGHRIAEVSVRVLGTDGAPLAGRPVRVTQQRHAFLFGCTGSEAVPLANGELAGRKRQHVVGRQREARQVEHALLAQPEVAYASAGDA